MPYDGFLLRVAGERPAITCMIAGGAIPMAPHGSDDLSRTWTRLLVVPEAEAQGLWGELFEHYRARLLVRIRFRMTPAVRSRIPPDDVIQEAYLRAFERRNRMTDPTGRGPMRWLGAICDRVLDEMLKRENRRMVASFDDAPEPARATTPSKHVQRGETIRRAERVLDAMEDDDRRLVLWFYYEDLDHDEIARRLGTSVVAARKRLERARRRMSEISSRLDLTEGAVAMPHEIGG